MKKLLLVDIPVDCKEIVISGFNFEEDGAEAFRGQLTFTEIKIPTQEEIMEIVNSGLYLTQNDEPACGGKTAAKILKRLGL